jgi:hypothetical protein
VKLQINSTKIIATARSKEGILSPKSCAVDGLAPASEGASYKLTGNCEIIMSPERFIQCLRVIRWTPINIASALQCELSWIEAMEAGNEDVPADLAK